MSPQQQWHGIIDKLNLLMHMADAVGRFKVVCGDGLELTCIFDPDMARRHGDVCTLSVITPPSIDMRESFPGSRNPARGKYFGVKVEDLVDVIWQHGGVNLRESRRKINEERDVV